MAYLRKSSGVPKKGKGARLSPKMQRFIDEYFVDMNGAAAVLRAGYKTSNPPQLAAELKNHPLVSKEIERRQAELSDKTEIERDYLLAKLVEVIDSSQEKTSDKLRAIELAGKAIALWRERQEISGPDGESIKMEQKTEQNVSAFKSKLDRLARRAGTGEVTEFPKPSGDGEA
jgi:phage terminase small subunit